MKNMREQLIWVKDNMPRIITERLNRESEIRKQNPFYPFNPPPKEILDRIRKWGEEG